ncbi:hypothetical protein [Mesorhizobium sp. M7A.F.Ca.US.008.03.1.1]|uniref:hypothetical protein n=1 Tax=Mesorhizobium sp. M7A.F.Ca.US.008.03.1.1 TaxID=2496742 RepID=UPI000FCA23BC|nr:hypothetical protein [Mesorhizobium sp. M7A.F.Ca.US.008.03.1.1]RUW60709.1 hypothetical protein EOA16_17600 [Mesorhizobium sp. M7A.F.Ca.US.008.03.1.1]
MTTLTRADDASPGIFSTIRSRLANRRIIILLAAAGVAGGLGFNWSWLVAAGVAPLLLSVLPCVAMCALGLCMHRATGRSCSSEDAFEETAESTYAPKASGDVKGPH